MDYTNNGRDRLTILSGNRKVLIIIQLFISIIIGFILVMFQTAPCSAQTAATENPHVIFLAHPGATSSDAALFTAVRAQLSGAALTVERVATSEMSAGPSETDLSVYAPGLAEEHRATLVFWVEDTDPCRIHFFVPDDRGGQLSSRTVDVEQRNPSSRYDVIATVAAVMIEGLIIPQPTPEATPPPTTPPPKEKVLDRRIELHLAYAGALTATRATAHGVFMGAGIMPLDRLFIGLSFSLYTPTTLSNDELQIELTSRQPAVHAAVRLFPSPVEIRLGLSYTADFRSFSTTALNETIHSRDDDYNVVHAFVLFLFASWTYRERVGIFGKVGASCAVNETVFRIRRAAGEFTEELRPFDVKLVFQLGLLVQL